MQVCNGKGSLSLTNQKKNQRPAKVKASRRQEVGSKEREDGLISFSPLSKRLWSLATKYETMAETGEPFGTIVIAEMGQKLLSEGKDVIFCAESIMSTRVPDPVLEETIENFRSLAVGHEAPFLGTEELRRAIATRFERLYGQKVNWENEVIVTSGSMQAEYYSMSALINPRDQVIIPTPSFFFDIPVELAGGQSVFYKLDPERNYFHDAREIERLVTNRTKMIVVCNPHNPTGRVLTEDELAGIAELARKRDLLILHDQVYERITFDGRPFTPIARFKEIRDRLITVSSFSKLFNMINYRLGYAIAPPQIIRGMELIQSFSSMGIPSMLQRGALAALNPDFENRHVAETVASLGSAREYAISKLEKIKGVKIIKPEGTNLLFPDVSSFGMSSMDFCKYLLQEAGVACAPGIAYHGEGHIRISLGGERIKEAIDRVVEAIEKLETITNSQKKKVIQQTTKHKIQG